MKIHFLPSHSRKTINWASGTSTELFIYPENGDFQSRDFTFRISTATVEADETTFSSFPAITRTLMILEGQLTLIHEDRYTKELATFDQDTFMGDWDTKSKGKVRDFNLMCKNGASGSVEHIALRSGQSVQLKSSGNWLYVYIPKGSFICGDNRLNQGDTLVIEDVNETIEINCLEDGDVIWGWVKD